MTDIVEFLTARLAHDQAEAEAARDAHMGYYATEGDAQWCVSDMGEGVHTEPHGAVVVVGSHGHLNDSVAHHIARHDPARVLAEVKAKRAIVALHMPEFVETINPDGDERSGDVCTLCDEAWPCDTLKLFAAPDYQHPHYQQAWSVNLT